MSDPRNLISYLLKYKSFSPVQIRWLYLLQYVATKRIIKLVTLGLIILGIYYCRSF